MLISAAEFLLFISGLIIRRVNRWSQAQGNLCMCHPRFNAHVDTMCRPDIQVQDHVLPTGCKARPGASAAAGSMVRGIRFTSGMTGIRSVSTTAGRHGAVVVKVQAKAVDDGLQPRLRLQRTRIQWGRHRQGMGGGTNQGREELVVFSLLPAGGIVS